MPVAKKPTQARIYEITLPDGTFVEILEHGGILFRPKWASREVIAYKSIEDIQEQLRQAQNTLSNLLMINAVYHHAHMVWDVLDQSKEYERYDE